MKQKHRGSLEARRQREGYILVAPWVLGLLIFFVGPLISSIVYAFSEVTVSPGQVICEFVGLKNFTFILKENPVYTDNVTAAISGVLVQLPIIIALSLVLAVVLNQKFVGRTVFRGIFFLPVIFATSVAMKLMGSATMGAQLFTVSSGAQYNYGGLIDFSSIISNLGLPEKISELLLEYLNNVFGIIWNCGIQTILFLSGLQSIPDSIYEVSKIEGASKWEEFWWITVPMLRNIISLVIIFTMIERFTASDNSIVGTALSMMSDKGVYDQGSAMLWFYFLFVGGLTAIVFFLYNRFCVRRWE